MTTWAKAAMDSAKGQGRAVHVLNLDSLKLPELKVKSVEEQLPADRSECVRIALESLHKTHRFDEIHFAVRGGSCFRSIQAQRAGLAFDGVSFVAHLDSCSQYVREHQQTWPADLNDLIVDFMEKYTFENADRREMHSNEIMQFVKNLHWNFENGRLVSRSDQPLVTIGIAHFNLGEFLPAALASLAAQTYTNLDVIIIDDGSTQQESISAFAEMEKRHPRFRFLRQANAGIGATRNRCLAGARGEYFIPMDADNLARPDMVERFVAAMNRNPQNTAMTGYFLAFSECSGVEPDRFLYAGRPTGGPHSLSCIRNVYGDANGIFRTAAFREIGGYETYRDTSCEDWEAYVKLIHAGHKIGVIPDYLFYYRHRETGFSRSTNWFANHQRVLRQFTNMDRLPPGEAAVMWTALLGFQQQALHLAERQKRKRYRIADAVHRWVKRLLPTLRS